MITILLAKVLGLYVFVVGIALVINPERFRGWYRKILEDDTQLFLGGVMALLLGAFIVGTHNVWVMGWPVILTVFGWMAVIKGAALMIVPNFSQMFKPMLDQSAEFYRVVGILWSLLGLFLCYQGWM